MVPADHGLSLAEGTADGVREVVAAGELDLGSAGALCARLDAARRVPGTRILLDLSGVAFCDSTGLRALLGAVREVPAAACRMALVVPPESAVGRLLTLTGLWEFLPARADRAAARASLGTDS
jgi:anti-anti-sigma factor